MDSASDLKTRAWEVLSDAQVSLIIYADTNTWYAFPYIGLGHAETQGSSMSILIGSAKVSVTALNDGMALADLLEGIADQRVRHLHHDPDRGLSVNVELREEEDENESPI